MRQSFSFVKVSTSLQVTAIIIIHSASISWYWKFSRTNTPANGVFSRHRRSAARPITFTTFGGLYANRSDTILSGVKNYLSGRKNDHIHKSAIISLGKVLFQPDGQLVHFRSFPVDEDHVLRL